MERDDGGGAIKRMKLWKAVRISIEYTMTGGIVRVEMIREVCNRVHDAQW